MSNSGRAELLWQVCVQTCGESCADAAIRVTCCLLYFLRIYLLHFYTGILKSTAEAHKLALLLVLLYHDWTPNAGRAPKISTLQSY